MIAEAPPATVRVDHNPRGAWAVALSGQTAPVTCETLEEAKRLAYLCAVRHRPCELITCDAYHRVLRRKIIDPRA